MPYREITDEGLALITRSESLRLLAYDDKQPKRTKFSMTSQVKGVPTIGYGHTKTVTKLDVVMGKRITKEQALALKAEDLEDTYAKIARVIGTKAVNAMSDNQYAALVSFVFNCGLAPDWKITKLLKAQRFDEVPDQFIRFVYDDGVRLQGLVNRRREEVDLWRKDEIVVIAPRKDIVPTAQPPKALFDSRTFKASMLAGSSGVLTAVTAAIAQLSPFASDGILKAILITLVCIATAASFVAAALKAGDMKGANA